MENEEYRTPSIEEFVQGFEFEKIHTETWGFFILDMSNNSSETIGETKTKKSWIPMKVWWKTNPKERIIEKDEEGNTWDYSGELVNFFKPFDEQDMIDKKLVRVKIK